MRIAELSAPRRFRLTEAPAPPPGPGEVQACVRAVGVCGSDMHYFAEGSVGDVPCRYPMVLGHEPTGEIVATGPGVSGWSAGDKVILEPAIYCYHCEQCMTGHHNVCDKIRFLSMPDDPGFLRDYVNLPVQNVLPMPAGLSFEANTLFEPIAIALHSLKFAAPGLGETAAVFGAGPIGLVTIAALRLAGAGRIWAIEPVAHRREMAIAAGADTALEPGSASAAILRDTGGRGVDFAIDCAAKPGTVNECIRASRRAGRVVVTGIPSEPQVPIDIHVMRRHEIHLFNVRRSNHETGTALRLLAEHPQRFAPLVTHSRPLENVGEGFDIVERYADGVGKMVITL